MHHHHPPLPIMSNANAAAPAMATSSLQQAQQQQQQQQQQPQQRRRKKRPNYGTRTVEVRRGYNGFGFTISGQQPCRLSCIISNSPAEQAGLRAGDFLISVNGLNVSKLPHETVVQLIGNSFGSIRMQIAENYYSDSSDEENANATLLIQRSARGQLLAASLGAGVRNKPRFLHHKSKMHRLRNSPQKKPPEVVEAAVAAADPGPGPSLAPASAAAVVAAIPDQSTLRPVLEDAPLANLGKCADVANVSAMVRAVGSAALEYRVIVGYLGTIEMPKQISHSSKLQTVRSCIRKLRQEKRQPTIVLMCITPECLRLQSANGGTLATYASARLNYVSSSSESENRFFGLVTSAVHNTQIEEEYELEDKSNASGGHISISHSCHVFVIDTKLIEHGQHLARAHEYRLQCTRDPISNLCLEFPNNSEYVVNLIRSMYTMRILPPASRSQQPDYEVGAAAAAAHSPQPSNHSEISTTTSNSDSGIGFNNDCTNISDRILVVDFAGAPAVPALGLAPVGPAPARPLGIVGVPDNRLTVRAMPDRDPKSSSASCSLRRPNLLASFNLIKSPATNLTATRSCDDVLNLLVDEPPVLPTVASMDDISLHSTVPSQDEPHMFVHPACVSRKTRRSLQPPPPIVTEPTPSKLSAQVFGKPRSRQSLGFEAIDSIQSSPGMACVEQPMDTWTSLQNLHKAAKQMAGLSSTHCLIEATNSEPDLGNRALPSNASPFRRAFRNQSSFRMLRNDNKEGATSASGSSPVVRRSASLNASDSDVYIKALMLDELKPPQKLALFQVPQILTTPAPPSSVMVTASFGPNVEPTPPENVGPSSWGTSFERMLQDAAGMQTFAEFLKKEFSAENIYFWTACERYRCMESETERVTMARQIYGKHLANSGSDPVNVDSQARNLSDEKLASGALDIFAPAQKQIFNLMKFDSYQRFIRSDLYKSCVEAEQKQQPLPFTGADLDELLKTNFHILASPKLKKSASNAEDRRRKSLLPWHRKTRSKSRDRSELMADLQQTLMPAPAPPPPLLALLTGGSVQNSQSDLHSSRSSLSSFDAGAAGPAQGASADSVCSLCRVILTDGATTIVQTRPGETVGQLVERLLEKRNLVYPYYDVVFQGCSKSIDTQQSSQLLAGKEVLIERRVAFKLDLPDPKVISVKSKPKKQLHEVIRPILNKYNYKMDCVQVLLRDTQAPLDLMQPVTVADGQRLQIAILNPDFQLSGGSSMPPKHSKPMKPLPSCPLTNESSQGQLDELTNKMFSELLQSKADAAAAAVAVTATTAQKQTDLCSMKSNEAPSESSSSLFERMRRQQRENSNIPGSKMPKLKKKSTSSQHSEEATTSGVTTASLASDPKKPIIAKLKAGVKLQSAERVAETQDELLEGLKRAQLARLEDQRGTEINFDLPDFLKNKENLNAAASKLRKVRANLSPVNKANSSTDAPQPAPRLSITRGQQQATAAAAASVSPMKVDVEQETELPIPIASADLQEFAKAPPPLPPKPKVLPIKPSNWGAANAPPTGNYCNKFSPAKHTSTSASAKASTAATSLSFGGKLPLEIGRKSLEQASTRCAYLDQPSSSFV
ncbi:regulator of G-protein signaling loco isoform X1 [Drosophila innubila]|uniref:regulator of G-protein signaling loco isoform X1 n=1 Tax=Drosophila innubila TaxID=198719 RepID=UPI00148C495E|nr:regulator of G-protein signaling loco isoform X1 [Drosophila innubila]